MTSWCAEGNRTGRTRGPRPPSRSIRPTKWFSYGPGITLHGQGFRNPNLSSGSWTASPLDPEAVCSAEQVTVVSAGVLAPPQSSRGEPGQTLSVELLPKLFTVTMTGDCLWSRE